MPKQSKKPKPPEKDRHAEPRESFHYPAAMQEAVEAFIAEADVPTDKSKVIRKAIEEFLVRRGFWPWPRKDA
jgi:hypothetical protein